MRSQERTQTCLPSPRSEEHTSELQSQSNLVCRLLLEKKKKRFDVIYACKDNDFNRSEGLSSVSCLLGIARSFRFSQAIHFFLFFFFFNDTATTEIYTLSLHDALPIYAGAALGPARYGPDPRPGRRE